MLKNLTIISELFRKLSKYYINMFIILMNDSLKCNEIERFFVISHLSLLTLLNDPECTLLFLYFGEVVLKSIHSVILSALLNFHCSDWMLQVTRGIGDPWTKLLAILLDTISKYQSPNEYPLLLTTVPPHKNL